ncbi:hypothetical protein J6590_089129 [Homalodisca vitripennis]|nr:hypothetical protein J6590_089129 [Homalodisca vitripennis]
MCDISISSTSMVQVGESILYEINGTDKNAARLSIGDAAKVADAFNNLFASLGADQGFSPNQHQPHSTLVRSPAASMTLGSYYRRRNC